MPVQKWRAICHSPYSFLISTDSPWEICPVSASSTYIYVILFYTETSGGQIHRLCDSRKDQLHHVMFSYGGNLLLWVLWGGALMVAPVWPNRWAEFATCWSQIPFKSCHELTNSDWSRSWSIAVQCMRTPLTRWLKFIIASNKVSNEQLGGKYGFLIFQKPRYLMIRHFSWPWKCESFQSSCYHWTANIT